MLLAILAITASLLMLIVPESFLTLFIQLAAAAVLFLGLTMVIGYFRRGADRRSVTLLVGGAAIALSIPLFVYAPAFSRFVPLLFGILLQLHAIQNGYAAWTQRRGDRSELAFRLAFAAVDEVLVICIFAAGIDASDSTIRLLGGFLLLDFVLYLALKHRQHLGGLNEKLYSLYEKLFRALRETAFSPLVDLKNMFGYMLGFDEQYYFDFLLNFLDTSFAGIVFSLEAKDSYSSQHSRRVAKMCAALARVMNLSPEQERKAEITASIHDIGKIGIPDAVLLAPRRLTDEEFATMKRHPVIGAEIVEKMLTSSEERLHVDLGRDETIRRNIGEILSGIRNHHERWDGRGYPDGLQGEEIPMLARMIALCDTTDAMLSNRVYRRHLDEETCRAEIEKNRGVMYDPVLAELYLRHWDEIVGDLYHDNVEAQGLPETAETKG